MRAVMVLVAILVLGTCSVFAGDFMDGGPLANRNLEFGKSTPQEVIDALVEQIDWYDQQGIGVPKEMYDFYFAMEPLVVPQAYEGRGEQGAIDELNDTCPGTVIQFPEEGDYMYTTCGQTYNATNNCTYPNCRYGRDVMVQLEVESSGLIVMTTTGSRFDTYLCLYAVDCCGQEDSEKLAENNNNPDLCNGQLLAAGIDGCILPGTYWLILDGAGPAARGSYCLNIQFYEDECEF